jgi:hypothetical protein
LHVVVDWHLLATHASPVGQTMPQPPQSLGSLVVSSQPSAQQARVPVHAGPPLHVVVDWQLLATHLSPSGQRIPQPPQSNGSLVVSSHPSGQHVWVPVQAGPPWQVTIDWHLLATHRSPGEQKMPQPPQSNGSLVVSSHPSGQHVCDPVQAGPPLHVAFDWQRLPMHTSPGGQTSPQPPQSRGSRVVSSHPSGQHVSDPVQAGPPLHVVVDWQRLPAQVSPGGHTMPQPPQLVGSLCVLVQPSAQHVWVPVHAGSPWQLIPPWQTLSMQVWPGAQACPHTPQLAGSLEVSSQPDAQHWAGGMHAGPPWHEMGDRQEPPSQVCPGTHAWPQ